MRIESSKECILEELIQGLLAWLALPGVGLPSLFIISLLAATILPVGSEPFLVGYLMALPQMLWPAIGVATIGNTLGGLVSYGMGVGAHGLFGRWRARKRQLDVQEKVSETKNVLTHERVRAERWLNRFGAPVLLLAWLPVVGDPLCAVAGWLRLPFWQCAVYMAIGKFVRYLMLAWTLAWAIPPS